MEIYLKQSNIYLLQKRNSFKKCQHLMSTFDKVEIEHTITLSCYKTIPSPSTAFNLYSFITHFTHRCICFRTTTFDINLNFILWNKIYSMLKLVISFNMSTFTELLLTDRLYHNQMWNRKCVICWWEEEYLCSWKHCHENIVIPKTKDRLQNILFL